MMDSIVGMKQIGTLDDHQDLLVKSIGNGEKHFALESQNSQTHFYLSRGQTHALVHVLSDGQGTIDQGRLRDLIYRIEERVQKAQNTLAVIPKNNTLNLLGTELEDAMDSILDLRAMLGEE